MAKEKIETLVPVEEQPYPLPENWLWVRLRVVTNLINGDRGTNYPSKKDYLNFGIPFINAGAIQDGCLEPSEYNHISKEKYDSLRSGKTIVNDILYCLRGSLGKCAVVYFNEPAAISSSLCILRAKKNLVVKYLFYLLNSEVITHQQQTEENGSAQPNLSAASVSSYKLPLPPLPEQQRIVDRIESLFAKLDEAKEKAQAVVDGFEDRKAAILHKAFTGELTEKWRKTTRTNRSSWQTVLVKEVCHDVKVGIVIKPSQFYTDKSNGTPAFRSANVREFHVDDFDWVYLNEEGMKENKRSIVHTGDVLVVRSGNPGTACVVEKKYDGYNAIDILIAVPDKNRIAPEYLCAFTNSPSGRKLVAENKRGMALTHFNVSGYSALTLELPNIPEQQEIIRIMHEMLEKEEKSKDAAEQVISQIDTMKKAILARAFRGELGTNDPSEPPVDIGIS